MGSYDAEAFYYKSMFVHAQKQIYLITILQTYSFFLTYGLYLFSYPNQ